jgi:small subunit ribosomal protein S21
LWYNARANLVLTQKYRSDEERRTFVVKLVIRDKESIQEAVRRFRKLIERSGLKKEMRRREHFEKPSEIKRRAKLRAMYRGKHLQRLAAEGAK